MATSRPATGRYSDKDHTRPRARFDERGRLIPSRSSGITCISCGIPFALGFLPTDNSRICRECRECEDTPNHPALFDAPNTG